VKLQDKVAVVTGASKGIGRALALGFAREGARVVVNYHTDRQGAEDVVAEIARSGRAALAVGADVACVDQIRSLFQAVADRFGRLDVLVNNAAVTGWGDFLSLREETWDRVIDTNLKGTFFCSQQAAGLMQGGGGGSIINVSTNCAELGVKHLAAYAASKGGIHALTRQLAVELAPLGIRVNTFAPGPTLVERNLRDDPHYNDTWGSVVPLGRAALPEEMVGTAVFLAGDDSSYVTGQILFVDGGWTVAGKLPGDYFDATLKKQASPDRPGKDR
jgi:NAD(P)-dependent dehydrogenase (short-subunit alcohol dehydrogenase family)